MRSLTHSPEAVIDSPAEMLAAWPTVVTRSRCPRAFARSTQKPLSALWKVTRSTRPANASRGGDDEDGSGYRRIGRRFRGPVPPSSDDASKYTRPEFHSGEEKTSRPDGQAANQPSGAALADKRSRAARAPGKAPTKTALAYSGAHCRLNAPWLLFRVRRLQALDVEHPCAPIFCGRRSWPSCDFMKKPPFGGFSNCLFCLVGAEGFEPPTTCTPCRCATRLRYAPNAAILADRATPGKDWLIA